MNRMVLVSIIGALLTVGSGRATADDLRGDLQVMRPNGGILRISSPSADAWWDDYQRAGCVSCRSPQQAAQLLDEVETALGTRLRAAPRDLILPESLKLGWPHAWLFYPSTDRTSAYVVRHGGVGGAGQRWNAWIPATERMERLILEGAPGRSPEPERTPILPWALFGATLAVAFAWLFFGVVRRRGTTRRQPSEPSPGQRQHASSS